MQQPILALPKMNVPTHFPAPGVGWVPPGLPPRPLCLTREVLLCALGGNPHQLRAVLPALLRVAAAAGRREGVRVCCGTHTLSAGPEKKMVWPGSTLTAATEPIDHSQPVSPFKLRFGTPGGWPRPHTAPPAHLQKSLPKPPKQGSVKRCLMPSASIFPHLRGVRQGCRPPVCLFVSLPRRAGAGGGFHCMQLQPRSRAASLQLASPDGLHVSCDQAHQHVTPLLQSAAQGASALESSVLEVGQHAQRSLARWLAS